MTYSEEKMQELVSLLAQNIPGDGAHFTTIPELVTFSSFVNKRKGAARVRTCCCCDGTGEKAVLFRK